MNNIYICNKPVGLTSKDFADLIKEKNNLRKICFCGRLDPMARGEMLLLGNDMCKKMDNYLKNDKIYQFEICLGFRTDTDDPLGIIQKHIDQFDKEIIYNKINYYLENMESSIDQKFHKYSSIRINGKPAWLHSMEKHKFEKPKHLVTIKNFKILTNITRNFNEFKNDIVNSISVIKKKHTFRQNDIIKQWKSINQDYIYSIKLEFQVTSGFYVRQFVRDLSDAIKFPLMVYDINRIKIIV